MPEVPIAYVVADSSRLFDSRAGYRRDMQLFRLQNLLGLFNMSLDGQIEIEIMPSSQVCKGSRYRHSSVSFIATLKVECPHQAETTLRAMRVRNPPAHCLAKYMSHQEPTKGHI